MPYALYPSLSRAGHPRASEKIDSSSLYSEVDEIVEWYTRRSLFVANSNQRHDVMTTPSRRYRILRTLAPAKSNESRSRSRSSEWCIRIYLLRSILLLISHSPEQCWVERLPGTGPYTAMLKLSHFPNPIIMRWKGKEKQKTAAEVKIHPAMLQFICQWTLNYPSIGWPITIYVTLMPTGTFGCVYVCVCVCFVRILALSQCDNSYVAFVHKIGEFI